MQQIRKKMVLGIAIRVGRGEQNGKLSFLNLLG